MKGQLGVLIVLQASLFLAGLAVVGAGLLQLQRAGAISGAWFMIGCGVVVSLAALSILLTLVWPARKGARDRDELGHLGRKSMQQTVQWYWDQGWRWGEALASTVAIAIAAVGCLVWWLLDPEAGPGWLLAEDLMERLDEASGCPLTRRWATEQFSD